MLPLHIAPDDQEMRSLSKPAVFVEEFSMSLICELIFGPSDAPANHRAASILV